MKYLVVLTVVFISLSSCNKKAITIEEKYDMVQEKDIEIQTYEDRHGRAHLIGEINKSALQQAPYVVWFKALDTYSPKPEVIEKMKNPIQSFDIEVFFGTWCGDSKRDVPIFYKVLEDAGYNTNRLKVIAVGNEGSLYKKSPNGEEEGKNITNVPTFIFYKDGVEVNRIVESPMKSIEEDVLNIVTVNTYNHKYADF